LAFNKPNFLQNQNGTPSLFYAPGFATVGPVRAMMVADWPNQVIISNKSALLRMPMAPLSPAPNVKPRILVLRRRRVILDVDLAELYGVSVKRLNQQIMRNRERFPADFLFQLNAKEERSLRLQIATSKKGRGGRRYLPYAFTEHGTIMAATVLNSKRAVEMSVLVVRAFVRLREMLGTNRKLAVKIDELEERLDTHDSVIRDLFGAIKELMTPDKSRKRRIGFQLPTAAGKERSPGERQRLKARIAPAAPRRILA
jgi:phage regulator Rha-like protein